MPWLAVGYSLAVGDGLGGIVGSLDRIFFAGIGPDAVRGTMPEIVFAVFQMTFAVIAPVLTIGAWVERVRFPVLPILSGAWLLPVCRWLRCGGWLVLLGGLRVDEEDEPVGLDLAAHGERGCDL